MGTGYSQSVKRPERGVDHTPSLALGYKWVRAITLVSPLCLPRHVMCDIYLLVNDNKLIFRIRPLPDSVTNQTQVFLSTSGPVYKYLLHAIGE